MFQLPKYTVYEKFTDGSENEAGTDDTTGNDETTGNDDVAAEDTTGDDDVVAEDTTGETNDEESNTNDITFPKKKESNTEVVNVDEQIFRNAQLNILAIFLIVYLVVFIGFGMYIQRDGSSQSSAISTTFDFVFFGMLFVYAIYKYMNLDRSQRENGLNTFLDGFVNLYDNDLALFSVMLFVICFYLLIFLLRVPMKDNKPTSVLFIEGVSWFLLATITIHGCLKFFFNVDILDNLRDGDYSKYLENVMDEEVVETDASGNPIKKKTEILAKPEVFNVGNNLYTYDDAQAICKSMDARLATYDEVETAYNNGAEWCNYGWSEGQMAFFPTQKSTWNRLQQGGDCKKKNACGRPGVNGGYFRNPNIRFGANCFGIKPDAKDSDLSAMDAKRDQPYPQTHDEKLMEDKIAYYKQNAENLRLNSFNNDKWSRY